MVQPKRTCKSKCKGKTKASRKKCFTKCKQLRQRLQKSSNVQDSLNINVLKYRRNLAKIGKKITPEQKKILMKKIKGKNKKSKLDLLMKLLRSNIANQNSMQKGRLAPMNSLKDFLARGAAGGLLKLGITPELQKSLLDLINSIKGTRVGDKVEDMVEGASKIAEKVKKHLNTTESWSKWVSDKIKSYDDLLDMLIVGGVLLKTQADLLRVSALGQRLFNWFQRWRAQRRGAGGDAGDAGDDPDPDVGGGGGGDDDDGDDGPDVGGAGAGGAGGAAGAGDLLAIEYGGAGGAEGGGGDDDDDDPDVGGAGAGGAGGGGAGEDVDDDPNVGGGAGGDRFGGAIVAVRPGGNRMEGYHPMRGGLVSDRFNEDVRQAVLAAAGLAARQGFAALLQQRYGPRANIPIQLLMSAANIVPNPNVIQNALMGPEGQPGGQAGDVDINLDPGQVAAPIVPEEPNVQPDRYNLRNRNEMRPGRAYDDIFTGQIIQPWMREQAQALGQDAVNMLFDNMMNP